MTSQRIAQGRERIVRDNGPRPSETGRRQRHVSIGVRTRESSQNTGYCSPPPLRERSPDYVSAIPLGSSYASSHYGPTTIRRKSRASRWGRRCGGRCYGSISSSASTSTTYSYCRERGRSCRRYTCGASSTSTTVSRGAISSASSTSTWPYGCRCGPRAS